MDNRKRWTHQQNQLRQFLAAKVHFQQAVNLFLRQHAAVHSSQISKSRVWSLQDEVIAGLTDGHLRICLRPGLNSIAWLLWHTARIEDVTMNLLVLEQPQVLTRTDWAARLNLPLRNVGTGMSDAEVGLFSASVAIQALKDYRAAVGRNTQSGVRRLQPSNLKEIVSAAAIQRLIAEESLGEQGMWLAKFWAGKSKGFFLTRTATSHNFLHLNQASRVRAKLGLQE